MTTNKIVFHLTNGKNAEIFGSNKSEITRLVSQFNNGHLMGIGNIYINPKELIAFIIEKNEEV